MSQTIPFAGCFTTGAPTPWCLVGIADDTQSSFLRGPAEAPEAIRLAYDGRCFNAATELGIDVAGRVTDRGDLTPKASWEQSARAYEAAIAELLKAGATPFVAGGDHAVTVPVVRAFRELGGAVHVVQVDAHPDLYPELDGNADSHACTGARLLELPHVASLTQLGIRTMNDVQERERERFADRVFIYEARTLRGDLPKLDHIPDGAPVYLTIDIDGIDPAFAPGVSHPVPGGLTSRQVLDVVQQGHWKLVGMDVVEVNPSRDVDDRTAILAARLLHEGIGFAVQQSSVMT